MSTYREYLLKNLDAAEKKTEKLMAEFFDAKKSVEARLKAFEGNGTFIADQDVEKAVEILKDTGQDVRLRAAAAMGLIQETATNEDLIDYLIEILSNPEVPAVLKESALSVLQASTFSSPIFAAKTAAYKNALRHIVQEEAAKSTKESNPALKLRALELLALDKDKETQRILLKGLEDGKDAIIKPEIAIQLLSYDLHSDYYPTLRKIVEDPPNKRSKQEALRNLAADPESVELLVKTLEDPNEDKEIRKVCAVGLQSVDPEALQRSAKNLLIDPKEDNDLRVSLINTLAYTPDTKIIDEDGEFQTKLNKLQETSKSKKLKAVYRTFQRNKK